MNSFQFNLPSFWIGMLAASLLWMAFQKISPFLPKLLEKIKAKFEKLSQRVSISIENKYRQEVIAYLQENHLASPLFSLDEVAIPPKLIAPLQPIYFEDVPTSDDLSANAIPFMPKWPEVAMAFGAKTIDLPDALSAGQNIAVIGKPGIGKTFALSYLAARIAQKHEFAKELIDLVPIFVHVGDLPTEKSNIAEILYEGVHEKVSSIVESQLLNFYENILRTGSAIVILDGMDELPTEQQQPIIEFIDQLKQRYPLNRIISTGNIDNLGWLEQLDFSPVTLASWTEIEIHQYISQWENLWGTHISSETESEEEKKDSNLIFLSKWLESEKKSFSPFDLTLKIWSLFAGDMSGNSEYAAMDAYISRMTSSIKNGVKALEKLAVQTISTQSPLLLRSEAGKFVVAFEKPEEGSDSKPLPFILDEDDDQLNELFAEIESLKTEEVLPLEIPIEEKKVKEKKIKSRHVRRIIPELVNSNILRYRENGRLSFQHILIAGYLAGKGLWKVHGGKSLLAQSNWVGKSLAIQSLAAQNQADDLIQPMVEESNRDPLKIALIEMAGWLRNTPNDVSWRSHVVKLIANTLNLDTLPIGVRAQLVSDLALSRENGILALFIQMIESNNYGVKILGTLGCGLMKEERATEPLGEMIYENSPTLGYLACSALVAINTQKSLEIVTGAMLNASEEVRRAAAEALSHHEEEGHEVLKDATKVEDLLVRRATVFGLAKVDEPWADMLLNEIQIEDTQWVVRSAAAQVLEDKENIHPQVPQPFTPIHELPWLIAYASELGIGISPGQTGWDMLQKALENGTELNKLASLEIYRRFPTEGKVALPQMYEMINQSSNWQLKEAAFNTIWTMGASSIDLPPLNQFSETVT